MRRRLRRPRRDRAQGAAQDPAARYPSVAELADDLRRISADFGARPARHLALPRRQAPAPTPRAVAAALGLAT
jgi:hypothetical protein